MDVRRCSSIIGAALVVATGAVARADAPVVPGHAILARTQGDALVIWDATAEVTEIVKNKLGDDAAKDRLERDALEEAALQQPHLPDATSIAVRVIYTKTGAVSPTYGSATFEGVERYAVLTLSAADAKSDRDKWKEAAAGTGYLPAWVDFSVVGTLPPR